MLQGKPPVAEDNATSDRQQTRQPALDQAVIALLRELEIRHARGDLTLHDPILAMAREHVECAVAMGANAEHRVALDALLGAVAARQQRSGDVTVESRTPHLNGVVLPMAPVILKRSESF